VSQATLLLDGVVGEGYLLSSLSYDDKSFSGQSQDTTIRGNFFKPDGTKMYLAGDTSDTIYQYTLSTAWDVSTASYDSKSYNVTQGGGLYIFYIKPDGTKLYYTSLSNDTVYQYSLSTAWDISTASYDSKSFLLSSQDSLPLGCTFNSDGTKFYTTGLSNYRIYQYSLSTAWDISTASYDSIFVQTETGVNNPYDVIFNSNGTKMFLMDISTDSIYPYTLSTAFNIGTASYDGSSYLVNAQEGAPNSISFKDDGSKLYISGPTTDTIYQYSTATPATITYPSTLEWPSGTAPTSPAIGDTDVLTFSTRDGGTSYQAVQAIDGAA